MSSGAWAGPGVLCFESCRIVYLPARPERTPTHLLNSCADCSGWRQPQDLCRRHNRSGLEEDGEPGRRPAARSSLLALSLHPLIMHRVLIASAAGTAAARCRSMAMMRGPCIHTIMAWLLTAQRCAPVSAGEVAGGTFVFFWRHPLFLYLSGSAAHQPALPCPRPRPRPCPRPCPPLPSAAIGQYGGMDFNTDNRDSTVFSGAEGVEFWVRSADGIPDVVFRIGDIMRVSRGRERSSSSSSSSSEGVRRIGGRGQAGRSRNWRGRCEPGRQRPLHHCPLQGGCAKQHNLAAYATQEIKDGWQRIYFPIADFECNAGVSRLLREISFCELQSCVCSAVFRVTPCCCFSSPLLQISLSDVNRVQWENRNPSKQTLCVKDLQILPLATRPVASAGRR